MFLHALPPLQQTAFLSLAARLTAADAHLHDAELAVLTQMREELGLPLTWRPALEPNDALLACFTTPRERAIALLEWLRLIRTDGQIAPEEHHFLRHAAATFAIPPDRVRALARWLDRHQALLREGERLLGAGETP